MGTTPALGSVQTQLAGGLLTQFNVSIGLNLQSTLTDWPSRQNTQYGAMQGLMNNDWHSLSDFKFQMALYSSSFHAGRIAWALIKALVPSNLKMLATLLHIPAFGSVPIGPSIL